jgi:hypothetical protein
LSYSLGLKGTELAATAHRFEVTGGPVHKYEIESLLERIEAIQRDVLRHLDEELQMVQMQGMTEVLMELRRSLAVVRRRLKRMNGLRASTPVPARQSSHKRH